MKKYGYDRRYRGMLLKSFKFVFVFIYVFNKNSYFFLSVNSFIWICMFDGLFDYRYIICFCREERFRLDNLIGIRKWTILSRIDVIIRVEFFSSWTEEKW